MGLFLFLVLINDLGFEDQVNNAGDLITSNKKVKEMNVIHLKYVDAFSVAESVKMSSQLDSVPVSERPQPDMFRGRTGHQLRTEGSKVIEQLQKTQAYAAVNKMKLNLKKTNLMLFKPSRTNDFMPEVEFDGTRFDLVEKNKTPG